MALFEGLEHFIGLGNGWPQQQRQEAEQEARRQHRDDYETRTSVVRFPVCNICHRLPIKHRSP
jgi:hypothetical protein